MKNSLKVVITVIIAFLIAGAFIYFTEKSKDKQFENLNTPTDCFPSK